MKVKDFHIRRARNISNKGKSSMITLPEGNNGKHFLCMEITESMASYLMTTGQLKKRGVKMMNDILENPRKVLDTIE